MTVDKFSKDNFTRVFISKYRYCCFYSIDDTKYKDVVVANNAAFFITGCI